MNRIAPRRGPFGELILDLADVGPSRAKLLPDPPDGKVAVQLLAYSVGASIPGEFAFYLAAPEASKLWTTVSVIKAAPSPIHPLERWPFAWAWCTFPTRFPGAASSFMNPMPP
jgi:hypothetical protein